MKVFALFILSTLITVATYAEDKTITICSYEWPPHHGTTLKDGGYTADIIKEIFEPQGYTVKKMFLPWKRAQKFAQEGKECDAITEIYFNKERLDYYWFGVPYSTHEVYLIGLKSHPVKEYDSLEELKTYTIGHNRGGSLTKEFDAADYLNKEETDGYSKGIEMLLKGRLDFFVAARSVALYEASKLNSAEKIHTVGEVMQRQYVHMAFSKKNPQNLFRMQDYNQGLFLLLRSGRYAEIMKKHGLQ
ncbi:MAG: transporter substrate-binding domain-containing protein [Sulfurimonadaceae bacterium]|nr:transporter substrate-binding domain-containing protein [Sulfurimonadaceae bacterium]